MARDFSGSGQYIDLGVLSSSFAVPYTISAWINADDVTTGTVVAGWRNNGGRIAFQLQIGGSSKLYIIHGESVFTQAEQTGLTTGTWIHILGTMTSGRTGQAFVNGSGGTTNSAGNALSANPTNKAGIGGYHDTGIGFVGLTNGRIAELAFWTDVLTQDEITSLASAASPLLVRPSKLLAYWPLLARTTNEEDWVGGVTGTVTGATASEHPRVIRATSRGRVYFGQASSNTTVSPTVGSIIVAGSAPTVKQNILRQPTVGSVVVTGNAPTLKTNTIRQPAAGSVIVAGNAPAVVTGGNAVVNPNTGTIVVSGLAPTLKVNTIRQPTVGSVVVAGTAPTVRQGIVRLPTVGSIIVAGLAPTVSYTSHVVRTPSAGTITVAGNAPEIIGASIWTNVSAASTSWSNASAASTIWTNI